MTGSDIEVADTDQEISLVDRLRLGGPNAMEVSGEAAERIEALEKAMEDLGEIYGSCVGRDLGRPCSYCRCDGKNLTA